MARVLCVWLPNWPIQRRIAARPELSGVPFVVYESPARGGPRITHVSPAAGKFGVQPGMYLADAGARWKLRGEKAEPDADREALARLALDLRRFSPLVGREEAERPEAMLLDLTGIAGLFGGEQRLVESVRAKLASKRLAIRLAVADTVGTAWAIAHHDARSALEPVVVPPDEGDSPLRPLALPALRLSEKTLTLLAEFGLQTIGEVLDLPRGSLKSRLGPEVLYRLDQALGNISEPIIPVLAEREFVAAWNLEAATDQSEIVEAILAQLCGGLAAGLEGQGYGALELSCDVQCEPRANAAISVGLFQPSAAARHFYELLRLRLERATLPGPVVGMRLTAVRFARMSHRQGELFPDQAHVHDWEFALLVDRLSGRLGKEAVVRCVPRADAQPEFSWREEPLLEKRRGGPTKTAFGVHERPLFLYRPPVRIDVVSVVPDGPPIRFARGGREYTILHNLGPERIETGWWRKRGIRRDYYRVETQAGWYWLFRSLHSNRWYLHGEFA